MARTKEQAADFARTVKRMVQKSDDLIYRCDSFGKDDFSDDGSLEMKMLRALSAGTAAVDVDIEIVGFNASDPSDIISLEDAAYLGAQGADIEAYTQRTEPWRPVVYVQNRFEY